MKSLFDKELTEMEREVRDLKTIHQRGLGMTRFYEAEISKSFDYYADVTVDIADGEPMPAVITLAANIPTPIRYPMLVFVPQAQGVLFDVLGGMTAGTMKAKALSTSQIGSVS